MEFAAQSFIQSCIFDVFDIVREGKVRCRVTGDTVADASGECRVSPEGKLVLLCSDVYIRAFLSCNGVM